MAPSAVRMARSSPRDSATVMPVGGCAGTWTPPVSTPALASSASMKFPAASSPIAAASATRRPSLAAAIAVIEADPPTTRAMLSTSFSCCPKTGVTSSPSTRTSGLQSPIRRRSKARWPAGAGRTGRTGQKTAGCGSLPTGPCPRVPLAHQCDLHPGLGQRADRVGVSGGVGDELADGADLADPAERDLADLGTVRHHHNAPGAAEHDRVRVRLHFVVRGAASPGVDAVHADERHVEIEAGQARLGDRPRQLIRLAAGHAAGGDQLDAGPDRQLRGA